MYNLTTNTLFIGKKVHFFKECTSTNSVAHQIINKNKAIEGEIVICQAQTSGKGQKGNHWESEPLKNLTFSVILTPTFLKIEEQFQLNMVVSLAVYEVLEAFLPQNVKIKWPNDILVNNKKIAGILIENVLSGNSLKNSIVGVGININQLIFETEKATSLAKELGKDFDLELLLTLFLEALERNYLQLKQGKAALLSLKYLENLFKINEFQTFEDKNGIFEGKIIGVDIAGRIQIIKDNQKMTYNLKEVKFIY